MMLDCLSIHDKAKYMDLLGLSYTMTACNGLFLDCRIPMRTDKVDLAVILLQVQPLAPSLNLQEKHFGVSGKYVIAFCLADSAINKLNVVESRDFESSHNGINLVTEMAEDDFAVPVAAPGQQLCHYQVDFG